MPWPRRRLLLCALLALWLAPAPASAADPVDEATTTDESAGPRRARPRIATSRKRPRPSLRDRSQYKTVVDPATGRPREVFRRHRFLPVVNVLRDPGFGTIVGLRARYVNRLPGAAFNRIQLDVALRLSTRRIQDHDIRLQLRDLLGRRELMVFSLFMDNDPAYPYLGVAQNQDLSGVDFHDRRYTTFRRTIGGAASYAEPFWTVPATDRHALGLLRWYTGLFFAVDRIAPYDDSLLASERPQDAGLSRRGAVIGGLQWDRRDNEWNPTDGALHESSLTLAGPWVGGSSAWARVNLTARWYRSLGTPKLVFAQMAVFDGLIGIPPLIPLGELGGLDPYEGLGGRSIGRGFYRRRFIGDTKAGVMTELRYQPFDLKVFRWTLGLGTRAFFDLVKVFRKNESLHANVHPSGGGGLYVIWDRFFVFRLDVAFTREGPGVYLAGEHPF
ncbi:MAG: BamA/TamA family outer membrane protein [Nannocystaceae bacterium]